MTNESISEDFVDDDDFAGNGGLDGQQSIETYMTDEVVMLTPDTSLRDASAALRKNDVGIAAIGVDGKVEGVFSERDIVGAVAAGLDLDETPVERLESTTLQWANVSSTVDVVAEEMLETYVRHVLVCDDDGQLAGIVSMRDVLSAYLA